MKDVQTIPDDELMKFYEKLVKKASDVTTIWKKLLEERNDLNEEWAMCNIVIDNFEKRKGYKFSDPMPEHVWIDVHAEDKDTTEEEYNAIIRKRQLRELLNDNKVEYTKARATADAYFDISDQFEYFVHYDINSKAW